MHVMNGAAYHKLMKPNHVGLYCVEGQYGPHAGCGPDDVWYQWQKSRIKNGRRRG